MYIRNTVILSFEAPAQIEKKNVMSFFLFFLILFTEKLLYVVMEISAL